MIKSILLFATLTIFTPSSHATQEDAVPSTPAASRCAPGELEAHFKHLYGDEQLRNFDAFRKLLAPTTTCTATKAEITKLGHALKIQEANSSVEECKSNYTDYLARMNVEGKRTLITPNLIEAYCRKFRGVAELNPPVASPTSEPATSGN